MDAADASSYLGLDSLSVLANGFRVQWHCVTSRIYSIEYSISGVWETAVGGDSGRRIGYEHVARYGAAAYALSPHAPGHPFGAYRIRVFPP